MKTKQTIQERAVAILGKEVVKAYWDMQVAGAMAKGRKGGAKRVALVTADLFKEACERRGRRPATAQGIIFGLR